MTALCEFMHCCVWTPADCLSAVFSSLDMSRSVSVTAAGQCRLAPLIQVILDCSHLYDYTVKLLFKLHSCESRAPAGQAAHQYLLMVFVAQSFGRN